MPGFQNANISDLAPPAREKTFDDTIAVKIPEDEKNTWFSWRKLWAFTGPGFLMSIAYLDPGNIESDLQAGAQAEYKLLWVLLVSHIVGMLLQRMSARLGVVSGKHMAEIAYDYYPLVPRIILWLMIEIAIVCSDMQEVIGTAIAIYLLSSGKIPLLVGVLITILDTFTFLFIDRYGIRKLEFIFVALISTMAISFGYEFVVMKPVLTKVLTGTVVPWCSGCGKEEIITAISIFGAVIMPHNFYLHSALVKGGIYLGCQFGLFAMIIWAIGIFAAGQSSTMTGTYTGQFVMEGFVRISWPKWKRVLITRAVAITPTLILCIKAHGIKNLTGMNDFLNCVQMVQLPFALIPMITFTSSKRIMHNFRTSKPLQYFSIICGIITIGINVYFIFQYVTENFGTGWLIFVIIGPFTLLYIAFILYLAIYCLVACELMNDTVNLPGFDFHRTLELDAPWITETFVVNDVYF